MWAQRLVALIHGGGLDRARAAEEGAKAAKHLLQMTIRATDYAPAVELEFEDVVDALLVADEVVAPDDPHRYRDSVAAAFAAFGIVPRRAGSSTSTEQPLLYEGLNFGALRSDADEVFRFIWQNADRLGIDRRLLPARRVRAAVGPRRARRARRQRGRRRLRADAERHRRRGRAARRRRPARSRRDDAAPALGRGDADLRPVRHGQVPPAQAARRLGAAEPRASTTWFATASSTRAAGSASPSARRSGCASPSSTSRTCAPGRTGSGGAAPRAAARPHPGAGCTRSGSATACC